VLYPLSYEGADAIAQPVRWYQMPIVRRVRGEREFPPAGGTNSSDPWSGNFATTGLVLPMSLRCPCRIHGSLCGAVHPL